MKPAYPTRKRLTLSWFAVRCTATESFLFVKTAKLNKLRSKLMILTDGHVEERKMPAGLLQIDAELAAQDEADCGLWSKEVRFVLALLWPPVT